MKPQIGRTGISLVEMVVSISIASVLLVLNASWLHQSMKYSSSVKQRSQHHQNMKRLARQLRDDVNQCQSISMADENRLTLTGNDESKTVYQISGCTILVERLQRQKVEGRETFTMAKQSTIRWDTSEMPTAITLIVNRGQVESSKPGPIELHCRVQPQRWGAGVEIDDSVATRPINGNTVQ